MVIGQVEVKISTVGVDLSLYIGRLSHIIFRNKYIVAFFLIFFLLFILFTVSEVEAGCIERIQADKGNV